MDIELENIRKKQVLMKKYNEIDILYNEQLVLLESFKEEISNHNKVGSYELRSIYINSEWNKDKDKYLKILKKLSEYKSKLDDLDSKLDDDDTVENLELKEIRLLEATLGL